MNKIQKFLLSLSKKERQQIDSILEKIESGKLDSLNYKKLTGFDNLYRVKKGSFRVIYFQEDDTVNILDVRRRNEKTYKNI